MFIHTKEKINPCFKMFLVLEVAKKNGWNLPKLQEEYLVKGYYVKRIGQNDFTIRSAKK